MFAAYDFEFMFLFSDPIHFHVLFLYVMLLLYPFFSNTVSSFYNNILGSSYRSFHEIIALIIHLQENMFLLHITYHTYRMLNIWLNIKNNFYSKRIKNRGMSCIPTFVV